MTSPEQALRELETSELFAPDFPKRRYLTHAQWANLSEEQRQEALSAETTAARQAKNTRRLVTMVYEIGRAKLESAVPLLATIWSHCPLVPVRTAAGHALRAIGSREARAALESLIDDQDHLSVFLAIRAVFDSDSAAAFDRFSLYFDPQRVSQPGGSEIPWQVLQTFGPEWKSNAAAGTSNWTMKEPHWFQEDERWLDLCVSLRRDKRLGFVARDVLRLVEPDRVRAKLAQARVREGPVSIRRQSAACGDLVARYRRGEHEAVWTELRAHEAIDADCRAEAVAVANETMTRVARCADLLAERLAARGWTALTGNLRSQLDAEGRRTIQRIEQFTGALLPATLYTFWKCVGGIDFVWDYNRDEPAPDFGIGLALVEMDPLCVWAPEHLTDLVSEWAERRSDVDSELDDPWEVDLAPDYLHKANISGGSPYGIALPHLGADPIFVNEEHGLPFVDYLRLAFHWGGFPRLERHADRDEVRKFVAEMTKDLEPF